MHTLTWVERRGVRLLDFQKRYVRGLLADDTAVGVLSAARGSFKTGMLGTLAAAGIHPESPLWVGRGHEVIAVAGSLPQGRLILKSAKSVIGDDEAYRWVDSANRQYAEHKPTGVRLRVMSSVGKLAMGLRDVPLILLDEPGSLRSRDGVLLWDALTTSLGKLEGARIALTGTIAPGEPDGWWSGLAQSESRPGYYIQRHSADPDEPWDSYAAACRANPAVRRFKPLREAVMRGRDEARQHPDVRHRYRLYRLNLPGTDADMLLSPDEWRRVESRPVAPRAGRVAVAVDLGGGVRGALLAPSGRAGEPRRGPWWAASRRSGIGSGWMPAHGERISGWRPRGG